MNINKNVSGHCKKKCEYSFDYPLTNLVARNKGDHISFRPDTQRVSPVRYNQEKYDVKVMKLYRSSVHTFGGSPTDAELMIEHVNPRTGALLMVCIPVATTSINETTLDKIIQQVSKFAPTKGGDAGEIILEGFSLSSLVPKKPYYSYTGKLPMRDNKYDVIIFEKESALPLSTSGHKTLIELIQQHPYVTSKKARNSTIEAFLGGRKIVEGLSGDDENRTTYYNSSGPNTGNNGNDEIYIECSPTGESGEDVPVVTSSGYYNNLENPSEKKAIEILKGFGWFILAVTIVFVFYKIVKKYSYNNTSGQISAPAAPEAPAAPAPAPAPATS